MSRLKFCKALAPLFFALVLFGLLLGLSRANAAEKNEENIFIVVDRILPILEEMGKPYEITEYDVYGDSVVGAVVYGNHVSARRVTGKYAKTWVELLDDEGVSLGFIKLSGVEPFPVASFKPSDATFYIAAKDNIDLLLMPGELDESDETDKKYRLSEYDYKIAKGELVTSYGEILFGKRGELDSSRWLLLGFETSYESGGDGGLGKRYAWARTVGFIPLNHYKPDNSKADHEWLPALMRKYNGESDTPAIPTPEALKNRLRQNGFWIDPTPIYPELLTVDDMSDLYEKTGQFEVDFITSDMFLHAYHLIFDHMLMKLEETYFIPILKKCLTNTLAGLEPLGAALTTEDGKKSYETTRDMLLIPLALLDGKDEKSGVKLSPRATEEIAKIKKAEGVEVSAIVGANIDYTQFLPRGHYTTSPALERYFGAMSFLGNAGLALFEADGEPNLQNLKIAALLTLALGKYGDDWKSFETPINFLVGEPDDGGLVAYQKSVQSAIGGVEQVKNIEDDGKIKKLAENIKTSVAAPKIRAGKTGAISKEQEEKTRTPEFRISGKRFTFDAYVMNELTSPQVGSDENPRNLPEG
ncbi:MAG: DUF3160 domain-containing protein, partial [Synergistaceae bacterium]|nr:DUF3160 domain-containing protein [Synergistaceae bacterium]